VRNTKAEDATLVEISKKHGVTPNQVLVRWALQKGFVPLPKSDNPGRIKQNADVFGFALDQDDMTALDGLDQGHEGALVQAVEN
jgi:diketogulonate reductase-like aldo/keto reductase